MASQGEGGYRCNFKILIPAVAVGSIMGRNGEVIHNLESRTGAKLMMSGLRDFYPGTKERVCLLSGNIENVLLVNRVIMSKMLSNPDIFCSTGPSNFRRKAPWRQKQVKIIIPQCTASRIIGKGGSNIEKMKSESGSFIQLSRKAFPIVLRERCVTVSGNLESNATACRMILQVIANETNSDYYKNVSYSQANFPLPNAYMSGPPFARTRYNITPEFPETSITRRDMLLFLETFKETLRNMSYPEEAIEKTADALIALSDQRVIDVCLSMMINWFYPRAFAVYERNKGIPGFGKAQPAASHDRVAHGFPPSMFAFADPEVSVEPTTSSAEVGSHLWAQNFPPPPTEFPTCVEFPNAYAFF